LFGIRQRTVMRATTRFNLPQRYPDGKLSRENNPKKSFKNKPDSSVQAHATLRIHNKRIEIGLRIPPDFEQRLFQFLSKKEAVKKACESL
jgi:hypothetical protein